MEAPQNLRECRTHENGLHFPYCNIILVSKRGVKPLSDRLIKESGRRSITSQHSAPLGYTHPIVFVRI
ncbi:Uncharacterized protein HZ326_22107 [Fusarium oxysporum f. sp. albedinis]|nr:Uncharacterized protein HZ326_22107 [Fusarium oxysporum f. sp. albedinis]